MLKHIKPQLMQAEQLCEGYRATQAEEQSATVMHYHEGFRCDRSGMFPLEGVRFHLRDRDYDLCQAEFDKLPSYEQARYDAIVPPDTGTKGMSYGILSSQARSIVKQSEFPSTAQEVKAQLENIFNDQGKPVAEGPVWWSRLLTALKLGTAFTLSLAEQRLELLLEQARSEGSALEIVIQEHECRAEGLAHLIDTSLGDDIVHCQALVRLIKERVVETLATHVLDQDWHGHCPQALTVFRALSQGEAMSPSFLARDQEGQVCAWLTELLAAVLKSDKGDVAEDTRSQISKGSQVSHKSQDVPRLDKVCIKPPKVDEEPSVPNVKHTEFEKKPAIENMERTMCDQQVLLPDCNQALLNLPSKEAVPYRLPNSKSGKAKHRRAASTITTTLRYYQRRREAIKHELEGNKAINEHKVRWGDRDEEDASNELEDGRRPWPITNASSQGTRVRPFRIQPRPRASSHLP